MFRLFSLLSENRNLLLFLLLEGIAFSLIVSRNDLQRQRFGNGMMVYAVRMQAWRSSVNEFLNLREENRRLAEHNRQLMEQVDLYKKRWQAYQGLATRDSSVRQVLGDTLAHSEEFDFLPCQVIKNTVHKNYNYLILNQGAAEGIGQDMGVISPQGIVGRVIKVNEHYAIVQSALNVDFKLTIKAIPPGSRDSSGSIGFFEWPGRSPRRASMAFVPETAPLERGYEAVTSEESLLFPPGLPVGVISRTGRNTQSGFFDAEIELAADFANLSTVYVIRARHKDSIDSLEYQLPKGSL